MNLSELLRSGKKIIGWGSGAYYDYFQSYIPLALDFLIDNDPKKWGIQHNGTLISKPDILKNFKRDDAYIIIFSSFSGPISYQIKEYGDFENISASRLLCFEYDYIEQRIDKILQKPQRDDTENAEKIGIVIQGPVVPVYTGKIIKCLRKNNGNIKIILSTWANTDKKEIDELMPYLDGCELNPLPSYGGAQNRNYQITSTYRGLEEAKKQGVEYVLKTRTDMFVLAEDILKQCRYVSSLYNTIECEKHSLKGRLIVPQSFTRKHLLFSPSDLLMYGHIDDLLLYWSVPCDQRSFDFAQEYAEQSLFQISSNMWSTECYLGVNYARNIGFFKDMTIEKSWQFYRDFFIVMENDWFDMFWPKNPHFPDTYPHRPQNENVSHYFWQKLQAHDDISKLYDQKELLDIRKLKWKTG